MHKVHVESQCDELGFGDWLMIGAARFCRNCCCDSAAEMARKLISSFKDLSACPASASAGRVKVSEYLFLSHR